MLVEKSMLNTRCKHIKKDAAPKMGRQGKKRKAIAIDVEVSMEGEQEWVKAVDEDVHTYVTTQDCHTKFTDTHFNNPPHKAVLEY